MAKYDHAVYNILPPDQKVLWWFDEYLRYDLLFCYAPITPDGVSGSFTTLVERYTTYRYPWADNYIGELWNLCNNTDIVYNKFLNVREDYKLHHKDKTLIIPPSTVTGTIFITYLANEVAHITPLGRLGKVMDNLNFQLTGNYEDTTPEGDLFELTRAQTSYACFTKHLRIIATKDTEQKIILKNIASYSIVVTATQGVKIDEIEKSIDVDDNLLYKNIGTWETKLTTAKDVTYIKSAIVNDYNPRGARVVYRAGVDPRFFPSEPPREPNLFPPSQTELDNASDTEPLEVTVDWTSAITNNLIYSQIPDSMFHGIFKADKATVPSNKTQGLSVSHDDLLYLFVNRGLAYDRVPTQQSITGSIVPVLSYTYFIERRYIGDNGSDRFPHIVEVWDGDTHDYVMRYVSTEYWNSPRPSETIMIRDVTRYSLHRVGSRTYGNVPDLHLSRVLNKNYYYFTRNTEPEPSEVTTLIIDLYNNKEYIMGFELKIDEIHACLGASEFAYYDDGGKQKEYYMSIARKLDWFAKAYGVAFNPDGTIIELRQRVNVAYDKGNKVTIPDGWTRGQFADNEGGTSVGQTGGKTGEERMGIAYQNRCNQYDNFDDADPKNNTLKRGDIVLCENFLQFFETYLEDIDKGLNWQEMGTGMLPSADGTSVCTYEGMGTLLAEVAYMLSTLSSNIYQTHTLALKNYSTTLEIFKGLGLPVELGLLPIDLGEDDPVAGTVSAYLNVPKLAQESATLHKRMMDIIANLAILNGAVLRIEEEDTTTTP